MQGKKKKKDTQQSLQSPIYPMKENTIILDYNNSYNIDNSIKNSNNSFTTRWRNENKFTQDILYDPENHEEEKLLGLAISKSIHK